MDKVPVVRSLSRGVATTFLLLCAVASQAGEKLDWLYHVEIPVQESAAEIATDSLATALRNVLIRVTGLSEIPNSSTLQDALRKPDRYVLQQSFVSHQDAATGIRTTSLKIEFEPALVHRLIRSLRLPIWPAYRPTILFLGALEIAPYGMVLADETPHDYAQHVRLRAKQRGLKVVLPVLDVTDRRALSFTAIWGGYWPIVQEGAKRYGTDAVLINIIQPVLFDRHRVQSILWYRETEEFWIQASENAVDAAFATVDRMADVLASHYAVLGEADGVLILHVTGVDSIVAFRELMRYLEAWEFVAQVNVASISGDRFELRIRTPSSLEQLAEHITRSGLLEHDPDEFDTYQWLGQR